eukprot:PhF_6_TR25482/c0_g1_i1/m.35418
MDLTLIPKDNNVPSSEAPPEELLPFRVFLRSKIFPKDHEIITFESEYFRRVKRVPPMFRYPNKGNHVEWFERIVMILVVINTSFIALDRSDSKHLSWFDTIDDVITAGFVLEALIRMLCFGVWRTMPKWSKAHPGYFRRYWNVFDFSITIICLVNMVLERFTTTDSSIASSLRTLRVLRTLRTMTRFNQMRLLVYSLLNSLPRLRDVTFLYVMFLMCFSIVGVQQYKGLFRFHCQFNETRMMMDSLSTANFTNYSNSTNNSTYFFDNATNYTNGTNTTKPPKYLSLDAVCKDTPISAYESQWVPGFRYCPYAYDCVETNVNPNANSISFDNMGDALFTLFMAVSLSDWFRVMYAIVEATNYMHSLFPILLVVIGAYFLINLTVVVVTFAFEQQTNDVRRTEIATGNTDMSDTFMDTLHRRAAGLLGRKAEGNSKFQKFVREKITESNWFGPLMTALIVLNLLILAMDHADEPPELETFIESSNDIFTFLFTIEVSLHMIAFGSPMWALQDGFNFFDVVIVFLSWIDLVIDAGVNFTMLRSTRVLRILKLVHNWPNLARWLRIIFSALRSSAVLMGFILLYMLVFTCLCKELIGANMFDPTGAPIRSNFKTAFRGMLTSLQIFTGDDWNNLMAAAMRYRGNWIGVLFSAYYYVGNCLLLNLFIGILLHSIDEVNLEDEANIMIADKVVREDPLSPMSPSSPVTPGGLMTPGGMLVLSPRSPTSPRGGTRKHNISFTSNVTSDDGNSAHQQSPEVAATVGDKFQRLVSSVLDESFKKFWFEFDEETAEEERVLGDERALFILSHRNPIRLTARWIVVKHKRVFDAIIMIVIAMSSFSLAWDAPILAPNSSIARSLRKIDLTLTIAFVAEAGLQAIAYGLSRHPQSYLRQSPWNVFDFFVVLMSLGSAILEMQEKSSGNLKMLKLIRTIRPLRFIRRSSGLKVVISALLKSLSQLKDIGVFLFFVWIVYAIMGVQLFKGTFVRCIENKDIYNRTQCDAANYTWDTSPSNFDSVPAAMQTLLEITTLDNWAEVLYNSIDASTYDMKVRNANPYIAGYIVSFIVVGCFFSVNLFVGALIDSYEREKATNNKVLLTPEQVAWVESHKRLVSAAPTLSPNKGLAVLDTFVSSCVVVNVLMMCTEHYPPNEMYEFALNLINSAFVLIFLVECSYRVYVLGYKTYFISRWNRFDFSVTLFSVAGVFIDFYVDSSSPGGSISTLRLIRVLRLLRVVKSFGNVQALLRTLILSLPSFTNIAAIIGLIFFIFAVLGMNAFGVVYRDENSLGLDRNANFDNFVNSFLLLMRVVTADGWTVLMYDCRTTNPRRCHPEIGGCGSRWGAVIFFDLIILFCMYMLLNLFIAVIMDSFEVIVTVDIPVNDKHVGAFYRLWQTYDTGNTLTIPASSMVPFLSDIGKCTPLGFKPDCNTWAKQMNFIKHLHVPVDDEGRVKLEGLLGALIQGVLVYSGRRDVVTRRMLKEMYVKEKKKFKQQNMKVKKGHSRSVATISDAIAAHRIQYWYRKWKAKNSENTQEQTAPPSSRRGVSMKNKFPSFSADDVDAHEEEEMITVRVRQSPAVTSAVAAVKRPARPKRPDVSLDLL